MSSLPTEQASTSAHGTEQLRQNRGCGSTLASGAKFLTLAAALGTAVYTNVDEVKAAIFQHVAPYVMQGWSNRDAEVASLEDQKTAALEAAKQSLAKFEEEVRAAAPARHMEYQTAKDEAVASVAQTVDAQKTAVRSRQKTEMDRVSTWESADFTLEGDGMIGKIIAPLFVGKDREEKPTFNQSGYETMLAQSPYKELAECEAKTPALYSMSKEGALTPLDPTNYPATPKAIAAAALKYETLVEPCVDAAKAYLTQKYDTEASAITRETVLAGIASQYDSTLALDPNSSEFIALVRREKNGAQKDAEYAKAVAEAEEALKDQTAAADLKVTGTISYSTFQKFRPEGWNLITGPDTTDYSTERAQELSCDQDFGAILQVNCGPLPKYTILDCQTTEDSTTERKGIVVEGNFDAYLPAVQNLPVSPVELCEYTGEQGTWASSLR